MYNPALRATGERGTDRGQAAGVRTSPEPRARPLRGAGPHPWPLSGRSDASSPSPGEGGDGRGGPESVGRGSPSPLLRPRPRPDLAFSFPPRPRSSPSPGRPCSGRPPLVVTDRTGEPLRFFLPADDRWRFPVRLAELPPELPEALVASEDRRFWRHSGVDPRGGRAGGLGEPAGGARWSRGPRRSPCRSRAWRSRGRGRSAPSCGRASGRSSSSGGSRKDELLEIYLNLTPYGGNVEGVGAAAWFYFGKSPDRLSLGRDRPADGAPPLAGALRPRCAGRRRRGRPATGCSAARGARGLPRRRRSRTPGASPLPADAAAAAVRGSPLGGAGRRAQIPDAEPRIRTDASIAAPPAASPRSRWRAGSASCGPRGSATRRWW